MFDLHSQLFIMDSFKDKNHVYLSLGVNALEQKKIQAHSIKKQLSASELFLHPAPQATYSCLCVGGWEVLHRK